METTGTRFIKLLKILIKIAIMFLVMTGLILINKKYIGHADGSKKEGQITSIESIINVKRLTETYTYLQFKKTI